MSVHEFEKKVRESMDELKLRPSEAVWTNVEKEIKKDKRRRRFILWLPLLLLVLGGAGYFVFFSNGQLEKEIVAIPESKPDNTQSKPERNVEPITGSSESQSAKAPDEKTTLPQNTISKIPSSLSDKQRIENSKLDKYKTSEYVEKVQRVNKAIIPKTDRDVENDQALKNERNENSIEKTVVEKIENDINNKDANTIAPINKEADKIAATTTPQVDIENENKEDIKAVDKTDLKTDSLNLLVDVKEPVTTKDSSITKPSIVRNKSVKWKLGITANIGVAKISEGGLFSGGLFSMEKKAAVSSFSATPVYFGPISDPVPATIEPGTYFSIGVFAQRQLWKRMSVSAGINYSSYSTQIRIGEQVNRAAMVNSGPNNIRNVNSFYRYDHQYYYTNRYHFIEAPLAIHLQLNRGRRLPIVWNHGISIMQMISTNALHFDASRGVYYEDESLFNKTQLQIATGFSLGLFSRSKTPLWIGPGIHYNSSHLIYKDVSGNKHLLSFSLDMKLFLKK